MQVGDETIRRVILSTGWKPGNKVDDDAVRAWFAAFADELQKACHEVAGRYKPRYTQVTANPEDDPQRMAKTAAENVARMMEARVSE